MPTLGQWAQSCGIDGVVWTALPPKLGARPDGYRATADEVIARLACLEGRTREVAEEYVRKALIFSSVDVSKPHCIGVRVKIKTTQQRANREQHDGICSISIQRDSGGQCRIVGDW